MSLDLQEGRVALASGRSGIAVPTAQRIQLDSGELITVTGTLPTFPEQPGGEGGGEGGGAVEIKISDLIDKAIEIYDALKGNLGGGVGGSGDKVVVTVEGGKGKKVTVVIE